MDSNINSSQESSAKASSSRSLSNEHNANTDVVNDISMSNKRFKTNVTPAITPIADDFIQNYTQLNANNNNAAPIYDPLIVKNDLIPNNMLLNIELCLIDYEKQIIYEKNSDLNAVLSLNDNIFLNNEKFVNDPYNVARVMKFVPKDAYSSIISSSNIKVFPAYTCDVIVNWHFRECDISIIARDKLYTAPRELIMSSIVATVKLAQYRGHVNLNFKSHLSSLKEYISAPNNFYFDRFYDRFSGEFFQIHCVKDVITLYKLSDGSESEYLKLLSMKSPYLYTELTFPFKEYMKFFISGENLSKNWRQQCNCCFKWCNYKTNMVKCDNCKELYHVYCVSDDVDKKKFNNKNWWCENCKLSNEPQVHHNRNDHNSLKQTHLNLNDKEEFAKTALLSFNIKNYNSLNYRYQYLGFNNAECLATKYSSFVNLDYWNSIKEIQVNLKKCQYSMDYLNDSERGGDSTITTIWNPSMVNGNTEKEIELNSFTNQCLINIPNVNNFSIAEVNFIDEVLQTLHANNIHFEQTYNQLVVKCTKKHLKIPVFNKQELHLFEQGIKSFGGDPYKIHANFLKGLQPLSSVVKFFYIWKKTKDGFITRGKWDKKIKKNQIKEIISNSKWVYLEEQSCYDLEEYNESKGYVFSCKYCNCFLSPVWYKVDDKTPEKECVIDALCLRCAKIWKKYGVQWKPFDVLLKQIYGRNNWKQVLEKVLTEKDFTLSLDDNLVSQNIEAELLSDLVKYIRNNDLLFHNYQEVVSRYKTLCETSRNQFVENSWKYIDASLIDGYENEGKQRLLLYVEKLELEYSGMSRKKNSIVNKQSSAFTAANNLYSMEFECNIDGNNYSIFITKNFDKVVLSKENPLSKLGNFSEGDININISFETSVILKNFKMMYEKKNNKMVSVVVSDLSSIRPIECQLLLVYKTVANEILSKAYNLLHAEVELNPLRKYLMNKYPNEEFQNKCSVCLQSMSLKQLAETEIICNSCGMNCHYYCYGEKQEVTKDANWQCESCKASNKSSCALCITKETDIESCRKLGSSCTPDALKLTDSNNKFVHVACALFTKGVEVSSEKFSPFRHITKALQAVKCAICSSAEGSVTQCGLCDTKFHITCAQDEEKYKIGFEKETTINPMIICSAHEEIELLPLNHCYQGATLWEFYLKAVIRRDLASKKNYTASSIKKCATCDNDTSLYWYPLGEGFYSCKNCHLNKIFRNVKLIQDADMDNEDLAFWDEYPIDKFYLKK